jgi:glycosyltransferase involved in cell wall biosynthesis
MYSFGVMEKPFFSIILPTFNRADFLHESVQSVCNQSFQNFEFIIVDDGSVDTTPKVVEEFNDVRIRYLYQTNKGVSSARNLGIHESEGHYICFIDDDDLYLDNHLSCLHSYIVKHQYPVKLISTNLFFSKNGELYKKKFEPYGKTDSFSILPYPSTVCVHSNIFESHFFDPDLTIREDHELFDRIRDDFGIKSLDEPTVIIQKHDENISGNTFKVRKGREKTTYHYIKDRKRIGFYELEQLHSSYLYLLIHYVRRREFTNSMQYLAKWILVLPFVFFRKRILKSYLRIAKKICKVNSA